MHSNLFFTILIGFSFLLIASCNSKQSSQKGVTQSTTPSSTEPFPIPGRPDNLTQANVDQLLANGEMNFDGFRFDNKRMDFINFDKGSFRGTTFYNCILNDGISRRKQSEPNRLDFEETNFYLTKLKRVNIDNFKFIRTTFQGDSITDGKFNYCALIDCRFYNSNISRVKFNNGLKTNFENIQVYTCNFDGGSFDSLRFIGGAFAGGSKFSSVVFRSVEFRAVNFFKNTSHPAINFTAGSKFFNVKFVSAFFEATIFGDAATPLWFENVAFENTTWRNGTANISFNTGCTITGAATELQGVNFASSVFNDIVFGVKNAPYKLKIKQCKFNECKFWGNTIFYNCDLENSTFPSEQVLRDAGVKFINCLNAPYNS